MISATKEKIADNCLEIETSRFGCVTVEEDKVITMTKPFLGFPESSQFFMRPHGPKSPFMWFQSLHNPKLAFVVIPAQTLIPDYSPPIPVTVSTELQASKQALEILLILTIPKNKPQDMTANLLGPIVLNSATKQASQVLLDPTIHNPCWPVFAEDK